MELDSLIAMSGRVLSLAIFHPDGGWCGSGGKETGCPRSRLWDLGTTIFSRPLSIHSKTARILSRFGQKFAKLSLV
jgi:hypothetical protein